MSTRRVHKTYTTSPLAAAWATVRAAGVRALDRALGLDDGRAHGRPASAPDRVRDHASAAPVVPRPALTVIRGGARRPGVQRLQLRRGGMDGALLLAGTTVSTVVAVIILAFAVDDLLARIEVLERAERTRGLPPGARITVTAAELDAMACRAADDSARAHGGPTYGC